MAIKSLSHRSSSKHNNDIPIVFDNSFIRMFILESQLLSMVRSVSEDTLYDTIEFNEFLQEHFKYINYHRKLY